MDFSFGKAYRISSKKRIEEVFTTGKKTHAFPFLNYILLEDLNEEPGFEVLISVPKKFIRKAHDRNYIKRCIREGLRKNKGILEEMLILKKQRLAICFVYINREVLPSDKIENKILENLNKIKNDLQK